MNRKERINSLQTAFLSSLQGWQADLWTTLPVRIESFDPVKKTCSAQPLIKAQFTDEKTGLASWVTLPLLVDCPVHFPSGGGYTLTFPLSQGDEALAVFSSRCIDDWWQSGGIGIQPSLRMHDLSDGFIFAGISSVPNVHPNISVESVQLRNHSGDTYVEVKNNNVNVYANVVNVTAQTSVIIKAPSIILKNLGAALKRLVMDSFVSVYNNHTHPAPGGTTGVPNQQSTSDTTSIVQAE